MQGKSARIDDQGGLLELDRWRQEEGKRHGQGNDPHDVLLIGVVAMLVNFVEVVRQKDDS